MGQGALTVSGTAAIFICNELVERGWLNWWIGVPIVMLCAFVVARMLTARNRRHV